jgi:hypothetical protein
MSARTTSAKSVVCFLLAVLSTCIWAFTEVPPLAVVLVVVACVALGVLALRDIRRSQGTLTGRWLAIGGIASELAAMAVFLGLVPAVHKVRESASRMVSA